MLKSLPRCRTSKTSPRKHRHERRHERHSKSPHRKSRHHRHRSYRHSKSRSPLGHRARDESRDQLLIDTIDESLDNKSTLSSSYEKGRYYLSRLGERTVERVKNDKKDSSNLGSSNTVTGFCFSSGTKSDLTLVNHNQADADQNINHAEDYLISRVAVVDELNRSGKMSVVDGHDVFLDVEDNPVKIETNESQNLPQRERKNWHETDQDIRRVVSNISLGKCSTTTATKTPRSLKNRDIWKSESSKFASSNKRPSVFLRLGNKENHTSFNTQKVPPMQRIGEIRNSAVYNDDTFGDINTSFTLLEDL